MNNIVGDNTKQQAVIINFAEGSAQSGNSLVQKLLGLFYSCRIFAIDVGESVQGGELEPEDVGRKVASLHAPFDLTQTILLKLQICGL